jgi:hypothetical protein
MNRLFIAMGLAALGCAGLNAQELGLRANIPFEFRVGETPLPAGEYTIHNSGAMMVVRDRNGRQAAIQFFTIGAIRPQPPKTGELVFNRYGADYFLANVWTAGAREGRALTKAPLERELARSARPARAAAIRVLVK